MTDLTMSLADTQLALALVFGFGLILLSFLDPERSIWGAFAGFIWLAISTIVLFDYGLLWFLIGLGIGLILLLTSASKYASEAGA